MAEERLQKILSKAGYGSRRSCEKIIAAGRVVVNNEVAVIGSKADVTRDKISIDGQPIRSPEPFVYIALYKPRGVLSTVKTDDDRKTVRELVNAPGHLYPVGRLDIDSEGLVLMTNDGELANRLTHPRYGHEKEYRVLVGRHPDSKQLESWRRGVVLSDGYHSAPTIVKVESHSGKGVWLRVTMREGRKRQIREIGTLIGLPVIKIVRIRIGNLYLGNLKPRLWRHLSSREVSSLVEYSKKSK